MNGGLEVIRGSPLVEDLSITGEESDSACALDGNKEIESISMDANSKLPSIEASTRANRLAFICRSFLVKLLLCRNCVDGYLYFNFSQFTNSMISPQ